MASNCTEADGPASATVLLTFGKEAGEWPTVASVQVSAGDGVARAIVYEGAVEGAAVDLGSASAGTRVQIVAEARAADGQVIARGRTPVFSGAELTGRTVPVLLVTLGHSSRPRDGVVSSWDSSAASVLLGERYALLATAGPAENATEAYDVGLLGTSSGGPVWPRSPRQLVAAHARDVLVLDEGGGTFADVFASTEPSPAPLSAADASALLAGTVLMTASGTRFLAGPTRSGTPSDRVLSLDPADVIRVVSLPVSRRAAAAVVLADAALAVLSGGVGTLDVVAADGTVTTRALDDDRQGGAALIAEDGSILLAGGTSSAGVTAPTVRIPLPCGASCSAVAVGLPLDLSAVRAYPGEKGRGFFVGVRGGETRIIHAAAGALEVVLQPVTLRIARWSPVVVALPGERLLVVGGTDASGTPLLEVEIVMAP